MGGMQEGSAGVRGDILDAVLSATILVVGVDAAKGQGLFRGGDGGAKSSGVKEAIVGVVVADGDAVGGAELFKSLFGGNGGLLIHVRHEVHIREVGEVVDKDGSAGVTGGSGGASVSGDKTGGGTDELIEADYLTWESGGFDGSLIVDAFGTPRFAVRFAVGAAGAEGGRDIGKLVRDDVGTGKELKAGEAEVSKTFMVDKEGVLFALSVCEGGVHVGGRRGSAIGQEVERLGRGG